MAAPAVLPLELISVNYEPLVIVDLTFNQPIRIEDVDASMFFVNDPTAEVMLQGYQVSLFPSGVSMRVNLTQYDPSQQVGRWLRVDPGNNVQTLAGQSWPGVLQWNV